MGRRSEKSSIGARRAHRSAFAALSAALAMAASLAVAPAASAAVLSTTTTVTATPATSVEGTAVTIKATVYLKPVGGLILTPSGKVFFSALQGTHVTQLGSATLGSCLLTTCDASITTTAIPAGSTYAQASYAGDLVAKTSFGSAQITVTAPPPPVDASTSKTCPADQTCTTDTITSANGLTQLTVTSTGSAGGQTVTASLQQGPSMNCPGDTDPHTGARATFDSTATTGEKIVHYVGHGAVGLQMDTNYGNHTSYVGCFGMPTPFMGYVGGAYTNAPFVPADGLYEAQLSSCANNSGQRPCFTNIGGLSGDDEYEVHTLPGDPRFIG